MDAEVDSEVVLGSGSTISGMWDGRLAPMCDRSWRATALSALDAVDWSTTSLRVPTSSFCTSRMKSSLVMRRPTPPIVKRICLSSSESSCCATLFLRPSLPPRTPKPVVQPGLKTGLAKDAAADAAAVVAADAADAADAAAAAAAPAAEDSPALPSSAADSADFSGWRARPPRPKYLRLLLIRVPSWPGCFCEGSS